MLSPPSTHLTTDLELLYFLVLGLDRQSPQCPQPIPAGLGTFETGREAPSLQVFLLTVCLPLLPPVGEGHQVAFSFRERALSHDALLGPRESQGQFPGSRIISATLC